MAMNIRLSDGVSALASASCLALMLLCAVGYFFGFAYDLSAYDGERGLFQYALNYHDHFVYLRSIEQLRDGNVLVGLNNDVGIAAIYLFLGWLFPPLVDEEFTLISFLFNSGFLCLCYLAYAAICDRLGLGMPGKLSFFANVYFIYFAQLINKDLLTVLAFLVCVYCGMRRKFGLLILTLPVMMMVRQQLAVFAVVFMYLMYTSRPGNRILWIYAFTSLAAAFLSVHGGIIGEQSLGDGFSAFLVALNEKYYVGYLVFNPLRVVQYFKDAFSSFAFMTETGGIDTAAILRIPQLLVVIWLMKPLTSMVTRFQYWLGTDAKPLVLAVVSYFLVWLMNPTINARYVMLITPVLVLFAMYAKRHPYGAHK